MSRKFRQFDTDEQHYDPYDPSNFSPRSLQYTTLEDPIPPSVPSRPLKSSIALLFSLISLKHKIFLLIPAIFFSIVAGGIAPFMTLVVGQVFNSFAQFPLQDASQSARDQLLQDVGLAALELVALAAGSIALSSVTSCLWIWTGEYNALALRKYVYHAVTRKPMSWFDTEMGAEVASQGAANENGPVGAGGLMAKFTRDTDDVRNASSLASGMLFQNLTTCIACLILAFMRSWALSLVILSVVPALMLIQAFSQITAGPMIAKERVLTATAGTIIERAVNAIATVKAFNAVALEAASLNSIITGLSKVDTRLNVIWGVTASFSQFSTMSMFVQAFWFGAKLVRQGQVSPGDVMAVFWACLIATSNLQMCIPQFVLVAKGKSAVLSLLTLAETETTPALQIRAHEHHERLQKRRPPQLSSVRPPAALYAQFPTVVTSLTRKIVPARCHGEISLRNVTFVYPSRPTVPVLQDVSLYLPANEMTFIVGGSGSGKSTIAQLLLQMYTPQSGSIQLDDRDLTVLDEDWARQHLAGVSQGCILFDMSVHDNVAMGIMGSKGRKPANVTRTEVMKACTAALMHQFISELPDGYDTKLGNGGANLSGGQKQRLAIARAQLRDPSVLILDEATSALDPTSRILVFEAIKAWRANKTTVVITHDLSQITKNDFVYVLKDGRVGEQGYRHDLEKANGEFYNLMVTQGLTGGFLPTKDISGQNGIDGLEAILEEDEDGDETKARPFSLVQDPMRPTSSFTLSSWMFDVVADLTSTSDHAQPQGARESLWRLSRSDSIEEMELNEFHGRRRPSSMRTTPSLTIQPPLRNSLSLKFSPSSPVGRVGSPDELPDDEKAALVKPARLTRRPHYRKRSSHRHNLPVPEVKVAKASSTPTSQTLSLWKLLREIYPTVPNKPVICFGLLVCVASGAMTPVFSFLLSRLLFEVSIGATQTTIINIFGGIVLGAAALDGFLLGFKYFLMETCGMRWVTLIRTECFKLVLTQDKKWFDKSDNSAARLIQILLKDGDDARNLVSVVISQILVVTSMLGVGLIWALIQGWQLTLAGLAIAPIFGTIMALQSKLIAKCEVRNKRARELVAKSYYETISNIRGIRSMTLDLVFQEQFDVAAEKALTTGVQGAFVEGCTYGMASGLIYLAEALLFYVGALLVSQGTYSYLQMVQVLNLVVFSVTIGSQLMAFTHKIAKSVQAARDFNELLRLSICTDESMGVLTPSLEGTIVFKNVSFSYPERPDIPVLKNLNMEIDQGERVAIVGTSGSGKSTIAYLLQRLYEPDRGSIYLGLAKLRSTEVHHLREHISVVSQTPHLFNATVSQNIIYGHPALSEFDVRKAAQAADAHGFIMALPEGYNTVIGENASLVSGGQAQRLAIARALARPSRVLILDECTSALDATSQAAVLESICSAEDDRTVVMVTHKLSVMKLCDRIVVLSDGKVAEQGSYEGLIERKGVFAALASGGEWFGE